MKKDKIFKDDLKVQDFIFDKKVVEVFDDMLNRSIPLYSEIQNMIVSICNEYVQENSQIIDLGSSQGNTCIALGTKIKKEKKVNILGIDASIDMIEEAKNRLIGLQLESSVGYEMLNISPDEIQKKQNVSIFISALTLQFIRPLQRQDLINSLFKTLNHNGIFILVEKTVIPNSRCGRSYIDFYHEFKKENGYSVTEIALKRISIENVLVPFSMEENISMLKNAGFTDVHPFFQWFNFSGIIALK